MEHLQYVKGIRNFSVIPEQAHRRTVRLKYQRKKLECDRGTQNEHTLELGL